ncbi:MULTISPECIES: sugar ABC transporter ATP-binding protein [unclassified Spirosoma]|uniref:sugar ABC transporter ATP-binding protein n=1 Tax=unclassified Spirosoma TaxID=2621999 RepID=UPI000960BFA9|nr:MULTISPECIES: sugar ABC transporter ATP-binding protein [unclassified Spirosoma]MBN8820473.1 sugar ABC transporter ATP-binding protein [Spirosoma sp.]OJW72670.1 MAG: D-xylose ABC transporter ATP-binding protein [Spirosoma sp. 48-14]
MNSNSDYILQVSGLTKTFSGVKALDQVQLAVRKGEVHALMGENGAGKSTLMKILIGLLPADSGEIIFEGAELTAAHVRDVMKKGISMIHQEMLVVPELTVAQNIFLGRETKGKLFSWLDDRTLTKQAAMLLREMDIQIDPSIKMKYLSVAQMQMVEIAKAISNNAKVIIMDEPTSALSEKEVATLFRLIKDLTSKGVAIIYISHKMEEITALADTITVLRDGKYIGTRPASELDMDTLITMMVGRKIESLFPESTTQRGNEILSVKQLTRHGQFTNINFAVHEGEVLGIGGLMGAGRTEVARTIFGLDQPDSGQMYIRGEQADIRSPQDAIRRGIGYVSEDRKGFGFIPRLSVRENITLASLPAHAKGGLVRAASESAVANRMMADLRIKAASPEQFVTFLSGGNQQKVVIGKVLLSSPSIIILDEPTRGIDIGAKAEIYKLIHQLKEAGKAVILISSELPELLGLSDRIVVMAKGKQTAELSAQEASQEVVMHYAMQV